MGLQLERLRQEALEQRRRLLVRGAGRRELNLGSVAESSIVASLEGHDRLVSYEPQDLTVTVDAGMILGELNQQLRRHRQWIPIDDGLAKDTVGGVVAVGIDSPYRAAYGTLGHRVLAARAWTPGFGEIRAGAPVVKNVAGYPVGRMFWGSRGAFGVVTQVTLKVAPLPEEHVWWSMDGADDEWFSRLVELARPWALLVSVTQKQKTVAMASWHGSAAMVRHLTLSLGPPHGGSLDPWIDNAPFQLSGAVPRAYCERLVTTVSEAVELKLEWQSGWFLAESDDPDGLLSLAREVREASGVAVALRGLAPPAPPLPSLLAPVYQRLRHAYDPDGILFDPWADFFRGEHG